NEHSLHNHTTSGEDTRASYDYGNVHVVELFNARTKAVSTQSTDRQITQWATGDTKRQLEQMVLVQLLHLWLQQEETINEQKEKKNGKRRLKKGTGSGWRATVTATPSFLNASRDVRPTTLFEIWLSLPRRLPLCLIKYECMSGGTPLGTRSNDTCNTRTSFKSILH
ncbi:hypothetical protein BaRGS_00010468, partial [Batillaria attramentaria]